MNKINLDGAVSLVTGASRGLGWSMAIALAGRGAHVLALARTTGALEELDDAIKAAGGAATLIPLDLTDDAGLDRLGAAIYQRWGKLDLLIHCAAHAAPLSPAGHISPKDLDASLAVNARATQRLIRSLDTLLKAAPNGRAVFVEDDKVGRSFHGAYAASKAAGAAIVRSYVAESVGDLKIWSAAPPAMPTALRARAHPGEDRASLTPTAEVAAQILAGIAADEAKNGDELPIR